MPPPASLLLNLEGLATMGPDRERFCARVEVDETYIAGNESGLSGGRAKGKKILTCIAIEFLEPKGFGRCRMAPVADASSESLHSFVLDNVEPEATVITDAWRDYQWLEKNGYIHRRSQQATSGRGEDPGELLPGVHPIASLAKRWLLGTHQGAVDSAHFSSYLDEFVFRFDRRRSRSRGMLFYRVIELAVAHEVSAATACRSMWCTGPALPKTSLCSSF